MASVLGSLTTTECDRVMVPLRLRRGSIGNAGPRLLDRADSIGPTETGTLKSDALIVARRSRFFGAKSEEPSSILAESRDRVRGGFDVTIRSEKKSQSRACSSKKKTN